MSKIPLVSPNNRWTYQNLESNHQSLSRSLTAQLWYILIAFSNTADKEKNINCWLQLLVRRFVRTNGSPIPLCFRWLWRYNWRRFSKVHPPSLFTTSSTWYCRRRQSQLRGSSERLTVFTDTARVSRLSLFTKTVRVSSWSLSAPVNWR